MLGVNCSSPLARLARVLARAPRTLAHHAARCARGGGCLLAWEVRKPAEEARFLDELAPAVGLAVSWLRSVEGGAGQPLRVALLRAARTGGVAFQ